MICSFNGLMCLTVGRTTQVVHPPYGLTSSLANYGGVEQEHWARHGYKISLLDPKGASLLQH